MCLLVEPVISALGKAVYVEALEGIEDEHYTSCFHATDLVITNIRLNFYRKVIID